MSWNIGLVTNTVEINDVIAKELYENTSENNIWHDPEDVMEDNQIYFNRNHMEHMDVLCWNSNIIDILKKHKVKGLICFTSSEGDNKGRSWGYEFDGQGNMFKLKGVIQWARV